MTEHHSHQCCGDHHHHGGSQHWEIPLVVLSGILLACGLAVSYLKLGPAQLPNTLFALSILGGGFFSIQDAWKMAWRGKLDIEALMILAAVGAAALGNFFEGGFLLFLFSLGHALEHRAMDKARQSIAALSRLRPEQALRLEGGQTHWVKVEELALKDRVLLRAGDRVPIDGLILQGTSSLDQAAVTGESMPVLRGPGQEVFAGTINLEASLEVEVSRLAHQTVLARLVHLVSEAQSQKGPSQLFARKVEKVFVPLAIAGALALTGGLYWWGLPFNQAVLRGISVLVAASPCALAISTPAAVLAALARAAQSGVLIKGGVHLEALGRLQAVAFDKTGTLTEGKPKLVALDLAPDQSPERVLALAASLESQSSHPLGQAIVAEAQRQGLSWPQAEDCRVTLGKGLAGRVDGSSVRVGSPSLFEESSFPDWLRASLDNFQRAGRTAVIVEAEGQFLAALALADVARAEAQPTILRLHRLGITTTIMLSGDNLATAQAVAREVGVSDVKAPLLPEGKVEALRVLSQSHVTAMVGDGVNDAPALATASVGVAMGGAGSDVALETADVVLMADSLAALPLAVELSRYALGVIRWNLTIALGVSGLLVASSCLGWVNISQAVVLHEGSTVVVVLNGLRLLLFQPRTASL